MLAGWPLVGWTALAVGATAAEQLAANGAGAEGLRAVLRLTARVSLALFLLAFIAAPLRRAWRVPLTAWLLANRRYLGVSFGVSHLVHLLAILQLTGWSAAGWFRQAGLVVGTIGGLGFVVLAAMVATSFDRTAAWLGPRAWSRLHRAGLYYLWVVFFLTDAPKAGTSAVAAVSTALTAAALGLRIAFRGPRGA
ncbi:MAG: hypothetical protein U0807_07590 [Candidatus Binatia bacterium]